MKYKNLLISLFFLYFIFSGAAGSAQLVVAPNQTAAVLANTLAGAGTTVINPTLTCPGVANGTFTVSGTLLAMTGGIVLTNGHSAATAGPEGPLISFNDAAPGDPAITALLPPGVNSYDACILEFDIVPKSDTVSFNYQFGSEEYRNAVCSEYTDLFAFFISGPGITGAVNMALVPGTNIPVEINSVNNGGLGTVGGANHANCTGLGLGSPFTADYLDNTGGTLLSYRGYTKKFRAFHTVTPCDTFHLKLTIADAGDADYDSGVFLEGGSLSAGSYFFDLADSVGVTVDGLSHVIVKGCNPATVTVQGSSVSSSSQTLHLSFGGTAVNGYDVDTIPSTVTVPADSPTVSFTVTGIPTTPGGVKVLTIYLESGCGVMDSISLNILDTPTARILTTDTSVCGGAPYHILVNGSPDLSYSWTPATGLSSTTAMEPIATPTVNTTYTMTATVPGAGCPPLTRAVTLTVHTLGVSLATADTQLCIGSSVTLTAYGSTAYSYNWTPAAGLNRADIQDPTATPSVTTTYSVTASGAACSQTEAVTVTVINPAPPVLMSDTAICPGDSALLWSDGNPSFSYSWSPAASLSNPTAMSPEASPTITTTYTLLTTETIAGTMICTAPSTVTVVVYPPVMADAGPDQYGCPGGEVTLVGAPAGPIFAYSWSGPNSFAANIASPSLYNLQAAAQGVYSLTVVNTTTGCTGEDTTQVFVNKTGVKLENVTPSQTIPYGSSIVLNADSARFYFWTPDNGSLSNPNINTPTATPLVPTTYTVYGMDLNGCRDSATVTIDLTYGAIYIPDAFTPNGDGLNDFFKVGNLGYYRLQEMSVYNRWGQRVFYDISGENNGWDGTFNGVQQGLGVFNYYIIITSPQGIPQTFKGDVTLIR